MKRILLIVALCLVAFVSRAPESPFCAGALHAQASGQDPVMPPEGNPEHVQPPDGAYCDHSTRPAHACACHAQCVENKDGTIAIQEDREHCRANCYKKHCHCPADKCKTPEEHTR